MAATDQIRFKAQKDCVKEKSQLPITVYFRDRATRAAVSPTTVSYRLDCLTTGQQLKDWTGATPGSSVTITVTPTENAIQFNGNNREKKQLTIVADQDLATQFLETFVYEVENVYGTT